MLRLPIITLAALLLAGAAEAQTHAPAPQMVVVAPPPPPMQSDLGGGFLEFVFGAHNERLQRALPPPPIAYAPMVPAPPGASGPMRYVNTPPVDPMLEHRAPSFHIDPQFLRHEVAYNGKEPPGTIVVDTPHHFLYLVEDGGKAIRYGIGVARSGFSWSGVHKITAKREWPDWIPPKEMLERQPYLPHRMAGGPDNPLGARALYIGATLYRIHGSNEPWTIGHNVSSGCIRMRNVDVIDLYSRVNIGTKVVVIGPHGSDRNYIPPPTSDPNNVEVERRG